jgi:periplasmic protein TonB
MLRNLFHSVCMLMICAACGVCEGPPKRITQSEALGAVVTKITPEYPVMARQLHLAGSVTIEIVIAENGSVESVNAVAGNPVLTRPAMDSLKRWKFKPFTADGAPVKAQAQISIDFKP